MPANLALLLNIGTLEIEDSLPSLLVFRLCGEEVRFGPLLCFLGVGEFALCLIDLSLGRFDCLVKTEDAIAFFGRLR